MPKNLVLTLSLVGQLNVILFRPQTQEIIFSHKLKFQNNQNTISGSTPRGFSYHFGDKNGRR